MGNCGDEFLAAACIRLLECCGVTRNEIAMLSGKADESVRMHGIRSFDRWSLKEIAYASKNSDTFLLGGGGIFQDSSSAVSPWYYWGTTKIASLCGCRVWAVGQSIGPLMRTVSRVIARNAFKSCNYVSVRDRHSYDFLSGNCILCDDLVLTLPVTASLSQSQTVFVNFRPAGGLEREAAKSFSASAWQAEKNVVGVAMSNEDKVLMESLRKEGLLRLDDLCTCTTNNWQRIFSGGGAAFGMRLHFGVMCLKYDIPCTLVPYDPKVRDFAVRWGGTLWNGTFEPPYAWKQRSQLEGAVRATLHSFREGFNNVMNA